MMLFRDLFAAATAASAMFVGMAFVVMVMPEAATVFVGVAFVIVVMPAAASVFVGVAFVIVVMSAAASVLVGVAFVVMVMTAAAAVFVGVTFVIMPAAATVFVGMAFVFVVMSAGTAVLMGVAFVVMVMPEAAVMFVGVAFVVVVMLFGVMGSFLRLMAVAAPTVMYMLFIVLFHGMSPYLEWKFSFLSGIILWCYFSIFQMHRKWSMRNTLIFQVGQGETIGLDRTKKGMGSRGGSKNEK